MPKAIMHRLIALLPIRVARRLIRWRLPVAQSRHDGPKQLLVDVSVIAINDARTGIQRVVRALWDQLLKHPPAGYRVRPICATRKRGYRYAPDFPNKPTDQTSGTPVQVEPGDIFLGLDLTSHLLPRHQPELARWKRRGVTLYFMVYDLLPVLYPHWFNHKTSRNHNRWLRAMAIFADHVVCISNVVKNDMASWLKTRYGLETEALPISTIPLGGDVAASIPTRGLPSNIEQLLEALRRKPSVLKVGTLEPRKGHAQVLAAFEQLWQRGRDVNFVIVGKPGWKTEALQEYLVSHPQRQHHLYWLHDVSDEMLELLYNAAIGVIIASEAEGFGLSLIEATYHGKPVLARDIPVFREIGGDGVTYFTGNGDEPLAGSLEVWLDQITQKQTQTTGAPQQTWHNSAINLLTCLGLKTEPRQHSGEGYIHCAYTRRQNAKATMTRLAIVSTPRSGNTWLRSLLGQLYDLAQYAVHTPDALDWETLPEKCILQLHWHRLPPITTILAAHNFRVVTMARHPLDILISILQFSPHEPQTACWLNGENGDETSIHNKSIISPEFLSYAVSSRAQTLLSVSREWWEAPGVIQVRYEELVQDTSGVLLRISRELGAFAHSPSQVIEACAIDKLRPTAPNRHFWKGQPGLWRSLLPSDITKEITKAQANSFSELGYECNPDPLLTRREAERRWYSLII